MIIGIDAHNLEGKRTGVGRYVFSLLKEWAKECHSEAGGRRIFQECGSRIRERSFPRKCGVRMTNDYDIRFILYFKDEIPADMPQSGIFENKLLKVGSTAKFVHWDLARTAKKDKVDILFCPGYVAPICYPGKIALALHDIIYEAHPGWFNWQSPADKILLKWVSGKSAQKAKIIFVPSEFSRQEVIKHYRVSPQKIVVTLLAADPNFSSVSGKEAVVNIKNKFGIKDKFVFYVGSIFSRRHLKETIEAFLCLAEEKPNFHFLIGGRDHTVGKSVEKLINEKNEFLGREAILQVDFIGDNDLKLLYNACAFFIWLSDYEGFGLPPLEAMSCGAPVITSGTTSLKEVVGQAALLIKNNSDVEEIYRAMKRLAEDDNLRQELAEKGREQAQKFSWEKCARETLNQLIINN